MESRKIEKAFRSRISVLLLCSLLALLIPCAMITGLWILICGMFVFIVFLFSGIRYLIFEDKLYIKLLMLSIGNVKIKNIISVERSYNPISSPAASLKRLRISLGGKEKFRYMLISPVRESKFIEELTAVNPDIYVRVPNKKGIWRVQDWDI